MSSTEKHIVRSQQVKGFKDLEDGDHIAVLKEHDEIEYQHHGIYIGFPDVVDVVGKSEECAIVRKVDLLEFLEEKKAFVKFLYPEDKCLSPTKVKENAINILKNRENWKGFNIVSNNCEHFATYCKTGKAYCTQLLPVTKQIIQRTAKKIKCSCTSSLCCSCIKNTAEKKYEMAFEMTEKIDI